MADENKNVRRIQETDRASLDTALKTKMLGFANETGKEAIGFKKSAGDTVFAPVEGNSASYSDVTVEDLAGVGNRSAGIDENGKIIQYTSGDVTGAITSTDGNVAGFNGATGKIIKDLGFKLEKNVDFDLVEYTASNGTKIKLGYDDVIPFKNDTGSELSAGTFMHLVNVTVVGWYIYAPCKCNCGWF
jgi:hypothetical protein